MKIVKQFGFNISRSVWVRYKQMMAMCAGCKFIILSSLNMFEI